MPTDQARVRLPATGGPRGLSVAWCLGLAAGFVLGGCDLGVPMGDASEPRLLQSQPADGATGVDRGIAIRATFDRLLWPRSVSRQSVRLVSGDVRELISVGFDPVERTVLVEPFTALPLEPEVTYRLVVDGVVDLNGFAQSAPVTVTFRTGTEHTPTAPEAAGGYAAVAPILAGCARGACHSSERPALGLDLSSGDGIRATAIGVVSRQFPAATGAEGAEAVTAFAGLPIIDVVAGRGRPGRSYLVYKVIEGPHLRGEVMPPEGELPIEAQRALRDWILAGAPTD